MRTIINEEGQEVNSRPSKTIPGQAYSIDQLIKRMQQGVPVKRLKMEYSEDDEPVFIPKDLTDIDEATNQVLTVREKLLKQKQLEEIRQRKIIENDLSKEG